MDEIKTVPIESIIVNPYQPRKDFSDEELLELSLSIKSVGLIHPPTVRHMEEGNYELLSGERRIRASKLAGLKEIPVYVKKSSLKESAEAALIENIQRVDLNPLEISKALKKLVEEFRFSQEDLSQRIGKKRSTIANYMRLLNLPPVIQASLKENKISMGHAKAILSLECEVKQMTLHEWILRKNLSVRSTEELAKTLTSKFYSKKSDAQEDIFLKDIEKSLEAKFQTKASISCPTGTKGAITLEFYSLDDLDRLLEILIK